jgi:hypothetical protein
MGERERGREGDRERIGHCSLICLLTTEFFLLLYLKSPCISYKIKTVNTQVNICPESNEIAY